MINSQYAYNIKKILFTFTLLLLLNGCATTKQQPIKIEVVMEEAKTAYTAKDWKTAEEKFAQLVALMPGEAEFWFKLGNIYAHTNQPSKAITAYKEVVLRQPKMTKAWHNLSVMSLRQTTHLFVEMLQYMSPEDPLFNKAKTTGDELIKILKSRRNNKPIKLGDFPKTIPDNKITDTSRKKN